MAERPAQGDFAAVAKDIAALLHQPNYDDGSAGPVLVRLAWYVSLGDFQLAHTQRLPLSLCISVPRIITFAFNYAYGNRAHR